MDKSDAAASGVCVICGHTPAYCPHGTTAARGTAMEVPYGSPGGPSSPGLYPEGVPLPPAKPIEHVDIDLKTRMGDRNNELEDMVNEVRRLLLDLAKTRVEGVDLFDHAEAQHKDSVKDWYDEADEEAPFFSEAYLYSLIGKDAARTVLALIRNIQRTLKMRTEDLV